MLEYDGDVDFECVVYQRMKSEEMNSEMVEMSYGIIKAWINVLRHLRMGANQILIFPGVATAE